MKKKDLEELKTKNITQLRKMVVDLEKEIGQMRMELSQEKVKNNHSIKEKKKNVARALTFLNVKANQSKEIKNGTK